MNVYSIIHMQESGFFFISNVLFCPTNCVKLKDVFSDVNTKQRILTVEKLFLESLCRSYTSEMPLFTVRQMSSVNHSVTLTGGEKNKHGMKFGSRKSESVSETVDQHSYL